MKGDGNEQIRLPPGNLRPESFAHFFCVKMGKSSLIVILELIDRPGHRLFVKPETYALIKRTADLHAVPAVFLFRRSDRPAALHTPGLPDDQPVHGFAACRADTLPAGFSAERADFRPQECSEKGSRLSRDLRHVIPYFFHIFFIFYIFPNEWRGSSDYRNSRIRSARLVLRF